SRRRRRARSAAHPPRSPGDRPLGKSCRVDLLRGRICRASARARVMRITVAYPSAALMSRVLSTPKDAAAPVQDRAPRFADAMSATLDATLAAQMAVTAALPLRSRPPARAPEKKDPRERRQNDERANDERAPDQRRNGSLWA